MQDGRVVVGVAESLAGLQALRSATAEARRRACSLLAVRAWHFRVAWQGAEVQQTHGEIAEEATSLIRKCFQIALGGLPPDVPVEIAVAESHPGALLASHAYHSGDLLVVGACAHRRPHPWRTSMARYLSRYADCPVLVVPPPALARAGRPRALAKALRREVEAYSQTLGGDHDTAAPTAR
jgi:nucleotide-binding universal stress UspA family protein